MNLKKINQLLENKCAFEENQLLEIEMHLKTIVQCEIENFAWMMRGDYLD